MIIARSFKTSRTNRRTNPKMSSTAAISSMAVGLIIGWWYKDSKILTYIISAVTGG